MFKHFHRDSLHCKLGHIDHFDFASYLGCFWEHLITSSLEISIVSWFGFLIVFWLVVLGRYIAGVMQDTEMVTTALGLNYLLCLLFLLLTMEQTISLYLMDNFISQRIIGKKNVSLEEAFVFIHDISDDKNDFDDDGMNWLENDMPTTKNGEKRKKSITNQDKTAARLRVLSITKNELRKQTCLGVNTKRVFFCVLVFIHSFMYGWFLFLNLREVENTTMYFGRLSLINAATSSTSSASSSTNSSSRMLLSSSSSSTSSSTSSTSSSSTSSTSSSSTTSTTGSTTSSHAEPSSTADGWFTCIQYRDAGTDQVSTHLSKYVYLSGYNNQLPHYCTIHNSTEMTWLLIINTFLPLLFTTFILIPNFLFNFAYQKSLLGHANGDVNQQLNKHTKLGRGTTNRIHPDPGDLESSCSDFSLLDGTEDNEDDNENENNEEDDNEKNKTAHNEKYHGHKGHHHGSTCQNHLFGHDTTTFDILIEDVAKTVLEERHAVEKAREMIIHALMRPVKPKILQAPHEPVTLEYFQHQCFRHALRSRTQLMLFARKKHSKRIQKNAHVKALLDEETMTYKEILRSRGKTFFQFLKIVPTVDNFFYPEEIDKEYLIDGIRALCEFRLKTHLGGHATNENVHHLSETFEHHLMRAIDTTGNQQLSEEEFIEFLIPTKITKKKKSKKIETTDNHYRSIQELVVLLEKANKALEDSGISMENGDGMSVDNPRYHLEKARENLLQRIGSDSIQRDHALTIAHEVVHGENTEGKKIE